MPTPLYGLPLYGDDDTAELDVLLNGQSTAIESALSSQFVDNAGMSVATSADLPTSGNWPGRELQSRDTGILYRWTLGTWIRPTAGASYTGSTDASGRVTITHGMGSAPNGVSITIAADSPIIASRLTAGVDQITATTFRVTVWRQDTGAAFAANPVKFIWSAVI